MSLVQSLLTAIVRADGDALVLHVGERPYVIAPTGTIELSAHGLNLEAMSGMLGQLLPPEALKALEDFGAVEHELVPPSAMQADRYTVVAARGGDDVWIELRRHRRARVVPSPEPVVAAAPPPAPAPVVELVPPMPSRAQEVDAVPPVVAEVEDETPAEIDDHSTPDTPMPEWSTQIEMSPPGDRETERPSEVEAVLAPAPDDEAEVTQYSDPADDVYVLPREILEAPAISAPLVQQFPGPRGEAAQVEADVVAVEEVAQPEASVEEITDDHAPQVLPIPDLPPAVRQAAERRAAVAAAGSQAAPQAISRRHEQPRPSPAVPMAADEPPSVVVPLTRSMRIETGPRGLSSRPGGIERLLRLASSRGASALYLPSQARPYIRADGDIRLLEGEPVLTSTDVESAVMELIPETARDAVRRGVPTEWVAELPDIGRIRCTTFRDYRGPAALFQMISARAASAEQLGLSREIQALSTESEGLVIVAGPRASGKSTLIAAFVDLVNRRRSDYVITLERQIRLVHDNRSSLISQREIRGSAEEIVAQARTSLRENPDVLVIEDIRSPDVLQVALDAAGSGLLVFISVTAACATAAVERILDLMPTERRRPVQAVLSETLRGAVAQVLLRKSGGGRLAARELLLTTAAVASLVSEGQTGQLPLAIDSGRKHGMVPLNDALVAFVQSGAVDVREAYRKAADRQGLLTLLKREGIDTSFVERLA